MYLFALSAPVAVIIAFGATYVLWLCHSVSLYWLREAKKKKVSGIGEEVR